MARKEVNWYCNVCGHKYKSEAEADKCEKMHLIPASVTSPNYNGNEKRKYPESVLITFENGDKARYYRKSDYR